MDFSYRVSLRKDTNGTILVTFPELQGVVTFGENREDALARAADALVTGVEFLIRHRLPVPVPSAKGGSHRVALPATLAAKVALHNLMLTKKVTRAALSRMLGVHRPQVDRLVDLRHGSRLEQLEAAYLALGHRLVVDIVPQG